VVFVGSEMRSVFTPSASSLATSALFFFLQRLQQAVINMYRIIREIPNAKLKIKHRTAFRGFPVVEKIQRKHLTFNKFFNDV